jgi:hypothetical protein
MKEKVLYALIKSKMDFSKGNYKNKDLKKIIPELG